MRTLVIITPGFPENEQDTTCLPAIQQFVLACSKLQADLSVTVVSIQYPFKAGTYRWHGIEVIATGGANAAGWERVVTWIRTYRHLKKATGHNCIGILSVWLHESALIGKWFAKIHGFKHFTWLQGQDAKKNNSYVKLIRPKSHELIAISEFNSAELTRNHKIQPAHIIINGIEPALFPEINTGNRKIMVLGTGSLISLKRWSLFIDVIGELAPLFADLHCVIIGEGPERDSLERQIKEKGLSGKVTLAGSISHPDVLGMMNNSRILFHPSEYEGYSTVILEGLYSGCKVVCAVAPGSEPLKNLYVSQDRQEMKNRLRMLLQEQKPAERVLVNTIEQSAKEIIELFKVQ